MPNGDCERLVDGLLMQPVNAISSLAFIVVGGLVPVAMRRRSGRWTLLGWIFGLVLVLVGVGSVAFHGPGGAVSDWVHDASITALLLLVLAVELGHRAGWTVRQVVTGWGVAAPALMLVGAIWPQSKDVLNAPLAFLAVLGVVLPRQRFGSSRSGERRKRRGEEMIGMVIVAVGAVVMLLSQTGGPLCTPTALVQGHAIWHLMAALGVGGYAVSQGGLAKRS